MIENEILGSSSVCLVFFLVCLKTIRVSTFLKSQIMPLAMNSSGNLSFCSSVCPSP